MTEEVDPSTVEKKLKNPIQSLRNLVLGVIVALFIVCVGMGTALFIVTQTNGESTKQLKASTEALKVGNQALKAQLAQNEKERLERSIGNCKQDNARFTKAHNKLTQIAIEERKEILADPRLSDESRRFFQHQVDEYTSALVPKRICTPKGIAEYNKANNL